MIRIAPTFRLGARSCAANAMFPDEVRVLATRKGARLYRKDRNSPIRVVPRRDKRPAIFSVNGVVFCVVVSPPSWTIVYSRDQVIVHIAETDARGRMVSRREFLQRGAVDTSSGLTSGCRLVRVHVKAVLSCFPVARTQSTIKRTHHSQWPLYAVKMAGDVRFFCGYANNTWSCAACWTAFKSRDDVLRHAGILPDIVSPHSAG